MAVHLAAILARRTWFVIACLAWAAGAIMGSLPLPQTYAAVEPVRAADFLPPQTLAMLRARQLRARAGIVVSEAPADTPPMAPASAAPVITRVPTRQPVIFVTIDDGVTKSPEVARLITDYQLPFTAFLTTSVAQDQYAYFRALQRAGMGVQNHTIHHTSLYGVPVERQQHELCATSDILHKEFGQRPTLFRPPYGEYDHVTQVAVAACGMKALVWWSAVVHHGHIHHQPPYTHLVPGDIVLLHFRPELFQDIEAVIRSAAAHGLAIARLEDYVR